MTPEFLSFGQTIIPAGLQEGNTTSRTSDLILTQDQLIDPTGLGVSQKAPSGLHIYLNVTAVPGVDTVRLLLEEQSPQQSGAAGWREVAGSLAQVATGLIVVKVCPATREVAASVSGHQISDRVPAKWRLRVAHSAGGVFNYSLGVNTFN